MHQSIDQQLALPFVNNICAFKSVIDQRLAEGGSLLNYAARGGCLETVELLIKKGVKLDPDLTSSKITVSILVINSVWQLKHYF